MQPTKSKYGEIKRKYARLNLRDVEPLIDLQPRVNQGPQRPPFQDNESSQQRYRKLKELEKGGDLVENLTGVRKLLEKSSGKGGVDRGGLKGTGTFGKVLGALHDVEKIERAGEDSRKAIQKLVEKAQKWLDGHKGGMNEDQEQEEDEVAIRKRQCAQAIVLQGLVMEKLEALPRAQDWDTYEQALREAETAVRSFQAASLTIKNPPQRRVGGDSDTYKILNEDGSVAFYFKPQDGESVAPGWDEVKGGGAPREVLVSEFSDQMKKLGFDFNVPKITESSLTSMDFTSGAISQDTSQTGVVIDSVKGENGKDVINRLKMLTPDKVKAFKQSIPTEDVHNILVLDFLTLNLDRHQGNVMFDMDLDDNGDVRGPTKITPIDAGNMLPPESVFNGVNPGTGYPFSDGMDAPIRGDGEVPAVGQHMLMQFPQAKEPFSQAMIDRIQKLDPRTVAEGMRQSDSRRQGDMAGKIHEDTFRMVEESVHFLKLVVSFTPPPMVNAIGKLYAMPEGFKAFKDLRRKLVAELGRGKELDETALVIQVQIAMLKAQQMVEDEKHAAQDREEYAALGGDDALFEYGWDSGELGAMPLPEKLGLLRKKTPNPEAETKLNDLISELRTARKELPDGFDTMSLAQKLRTVKPIAEELQAEAKVRERGEEILYILEAIRQSGATTGLNKPDSELTVKDKSWLLDSWDEFLKLGGYDAYNTIPPGTQPNATDFSQQLDALKKLRQEAQDLQEAENGGGEKTFNDLKTVAAHLNLKDKRLEGDYKDLKPKDKKALVGVYNKIKDLDAFKNYEQLVEQGELHKATTLQGFIVEVQNYEPKQ